MDPNRREEKHVRVNSMFTTFPLSQYQLLLQDCAFLLLILLQNCHSKKQVLSRQMVIQPIQPVRDIVLHLQVCSFKRPDISHWEDIHYKYNIPAIRVRNMLKSFAAMRNCELSWRKNIFKIFLIRVPYVTAFHIRSHLKISKPGW